MLAIKFRFINLRRQMLLKYYDEWEENKYNKDMVEWEYTGPKETVDTFLKYETNKNQLFFDAGCGTGLVGLQLKNLVQKLSWCRSFSKVIRYYSKNFIKLTKVDLNKPIKIQDNFYDADICVGTFTFGHVKPQALDEFVRITKSGGLICFTINEGIYTDYGLIKKLNFKDQNKWKS